MSDITIRSKGVASTKFETLATENVDLLRSRPYIASEWGGRDFFELPQTATAVWGQTLYYTLNTGAGQGHLGDLLVRIVLPAPASGNYCRSTGIAVIQRVVIRHAGNIVMDYNYPLVMQMILKTMETDRANALLYGADLGDSTPQDGTYYAAIPTFWSRLLAFREGFVPPLSLHRLNGELSIELTLNSATGMTASGASVTSNPTSVTLIYEKLYDAILEHKDDTPYIYKSIAWLTEQAPNQLTSGVSSSQNFTSFQGHISKILVSPMLVSDVNTAHSYLVSQSMTNLEIYINGKRYINFTDTTTQAEILMRSILFVDENMGTPIADAVGALGRPILIPFAMDCNSPFSFTGSLNTLNNNSPIAVTLTQTNGAACFLYLIAEIDVIYTIENGMLVANR